MCVSGLAVQPQAVVAGGGDGGREVAGAGQGVGDDPGAGADGEGVLAGQRGGHAAVGGQVGQAVVAGLEQDPGGQVAGVGGERVGAELVVAVEGTVGGVELGEQAGQASDQLGVVARLVVRAGAGDGEGQGGDGGRFFGRLGCGAGHLRGEGERERFGVERRVRGCRGGEEGGDRGDAGQLDEGAPSHRVAVLLTGCEGWVCFGLVIVAGRDQAELAVQQLVPFGWAVVAAFPGADHPDQGVVGGYRVAGGAAELACQLGHVPSAGPAPVAQVAAADPGHRVYLSVAVGSGSTAMLRGTPACSLLSLSHDSALPVD